MSHADVNPASSLMIRPATVDDLPSLRAMLSAQADYHHMIEDLRVTENDLERALFDERELRLSCYIGYDGVEPMGFALTETTYSSFTGQHNLYIHDLYIRAKARGRGYGKAFMGFLANVALAQGYQKLEWQVLRGNRPAIDFYKRLGASPQDQWRTFEIDDTAMASLAEVHVTGDRDG